VTPLIELAGVSKTFGALRPLRIERLAVEPGEAVAILGLDAAAAEVLVNLIMGASLPDAGEVVAFGGPTSRVEHAADWLALADRYGVVSHRAVLLESSSVLQNLTLPFTLEIDTPSDEIRMHARGLARDVRLGEDTWDAPAGALGPADRVRLRLGRALALRPDVLLVEHATAGLGGVEPVRLGQLIHTVASSRGTAILALTADEEFAAAVAARVLRLDPRSGRLSRVGRRGYFRFQR
jgi:ABC-type transporter Mla maintaining outer membrane lipid asymmetry ATPase subunit MlaF